MSTKDAFQFVLIGDDGVGKTSISEYYFHRRFSEKYIPTIAINFDKKEITMVEDGAERQVKVKIFDLAGQKEYKNFRKKFIIEGDAALLVFDITTGKSFDNLEYWFKEISEAQPQTPLPIILLANKTDKNKDKMFIEDHFHQWIHQIKPKYPNVKMIDLLETSAVTGLNIDRAFLLLIQYLRNE